MEKADIEDYTKYEGQQATISTAIRNYLETVSLARSQKTAETYKYALNSFSELLRERNLDPEKTIPSSLPEEAVAWFATHLKVYSSATEQLYVTAVKGFYEYLAAEGLASPNLTRIRTLIKQRSRRQGQRLPQFPRDAIEAVLQHADRLKDRETDDANERLRDLRDRAFLITLADTGMRVHEICQLRRGDLDRHEARAVIIGKGNKEAVVRFSPRSIQAVSDYLNERQTLDGISGKPIGTLPLFARHDRGAGKKVKPITRITGWNIVSQRVNEALGPEAEGTITPHSFRHYFVTTVLRGSGNLKLAQELARHKNIAVTQRYAHLSDDELDKGYHEIFNK